KLGEHASHGFGAAWTAAEINRTLLPSDAERQAGKRTDSVITVRAPRRHDAALPRGLPRMVGQQGLHTRGVAVGRTGIEHRIACHPAERTGPFGRIKKSRLLLGDVADAKQKMARLAFGSHQPQIPIDLRLPRSAGFELGVARRFLSE